MSLFEFFSAAETSNEVVRSDDESPLHEEPSLEHQLDSGEITQEEFDALMALRDARKAIERRLAERRISNEENSANTLAPTG